MEFSRIGKHSIKCVLSEEELHGMGYSVEDLMTNSARTQEFMNYIFELAEKRFDLEFHPEVKTVRADFLPDHTISLIFSEQPSSTMLDHLKDIISEMVSKVTPEQLARIRQAAGVEFGGSEEEPERVIAMVYFSSIERACAYAKQVFLPKMPQNTLYRDHDNYILAMDLSYCKEEEVIRLSILTDEYSDGFELGAERRAYLEEHAKKIIETQAIETLWLL